VNIYEQADVEETMRPERIGTLTIKRQNKPKYISAQGKSFCT
jgi:hypothetical protein